MKAALYARVSTAGQSVEMQLTELRQVALQRGWTPTEYVDHGESGKKTSRPALDRMLKDAQAGKVQVVAVWKLDRLGRNAPHVLQILEQFRLMGVTFVSLRDAGMDTSTPLGKALISFVAIFADLEHSMICERSMAGQAEARAKGIHCGRPRKDLSEDQVATALRLHADGWGVRRIANALGCKRSTLHRHVASEKSPPQEGS